MHACPLEVPADPLLDEREAKFLPDTAAAHAFWTVALHHLHPQRSAAPFVYARTTYFDTPDLSYYRSSGRRLRLREYAAARQADERPVVADRCYLEVKQSAAGRRTKTRVALCAEEVAAALGALADAPLTPCVATCYRRRALVDDTGSIRVTLDEHILLCRPTLLGSAFASQGSADVLAHGPPFVLEYKAWVASPPWLVRALAELEEAVGFSKFLLGMDAIGRLTPGRGVDRDLLWVNSCSG